MAAPGTPGGYRVPGNDPAPTPVTATPVEVPASAVNTLPPTGPLITGGKRNELYERALQLKK